MRRALWFLILLAGTGGAQSLRAPSFLARDMLAVHNAVRARVGVAPLAWSDRLAARAQDWAGTLLTRKRFAHRPDSTCGEDLFEFTGASASSAQVVNAWAAESRGC